MRAFERVSCVSHLIFWCSLVLLTGRFFPCVLNVNSITQKARGSSHASSSLPWSSVLPRLCRDYCTRVQNHRQQDVLRTITHRQCKTSTAPGAAPPRSPAPPATSSRSRLTYDSLLFWLVSALKEQSLMTSSIISFPSSKRIQSSKKSSRRFPSLYRPPDSRCSSSPSIRSSPTALLHLHLATLHLRRTGLLPPDYPDSDSDSDGEDEYMKCMKCV